ncbi:SIMPL domain-containing protein [Pontibacter sp. 172403-2]|uniref:SIMPL domain-containing protein n=1 Tax=Pontibacter rufus TaxID=2791028 RepID=UPI0018AFB191|nr:SIMPL domain-containing protein [Pontibacter sp. 172403-2]MBF9254398.1 SIMPL domain-containing protein [Pontibacter sp. 172403-2]
MKKTKWITLLVLLFGVMQVQAQQQIMPPLVHVNGVGEIKAQPDQVLLNFGVETRERSLEEARKQTDAKAAAVINYLKKQGVDAKNIQTSYVNVQPVYNNGEYGKPAPDFYVAQKSMTVLIKKLDKFDALLSGLYAQGVNRVDGISFQLSDVEKYKAEARKRAVQDARQKAVALTSELGAKLGRVYAINENSYNDGGPRPVYAKAMMESAAYDQSGPSIAGGEVVVTSTVAVSFIIE